MPTATDYSAAFRVSFPRQADWIKIESALTRLTAPKVLTAVRVAAASWHDHDPLNLDDVSDEAAQLFVREQSVIFAAAVVNDEKEGARGMSFSAIPEGYEGERGELRTAVVVLDVLGLLGLAGYQLDLR